jgi:tetratricopeptide (TPR) repeat protein
MACVAALSASQASAPDAPAADRPELAEVQRLFYTGKYEKAADLALSLRSTHPDDLDSSEIRTSALHFQLKRALREAAGKEIPLKQCAACPELLKQFLSETEKGQILARARLQANPKDDTAQFFLGKLDLNYVWLHLGTLGRRTGWNEYWEARKSLDAVLKRNPKHVRARTARAWIDYIVDTKMSIGTRWLLGGGSKKRALANVRQAADTPSDFFVHTEAQFALWEMLVRERNFPDAAVVARELIKSFPDNHELIAFLKANG